MKRGTIVPACAVISVFLFLTSVSWGDERFIFHGGSLELNFQRGGLRLESVKDGFGVVSAAGSGLQFVDGRTMKEIVPDGEWCEGNGRLQFQGKFRESSLSVVVRPEPGELALRLTIDLQNAGAQEQLVQIALKLPVLKGQSLQYFDGYSEVNDPAQDLKREGLGGLFPMAAECNEKRGFAIGIDGREMHGWLCISLRPANPTDGFSFAVRRVVGLNSSEKVTFVLFGFDARWGVSAAIERYYDLFPECFQVAPGTNPRIHLAGGYVHGGPDTRPLQWEESRRLHHSWQPHWGFTRSGDWMPDEKHWTSKHDDLCSHLDRVREFYSQRAPGNLMLHYLEVTQCESSLAAQEFPDSIIWTKEGRVKPVLSAVPIILGEATYRMFPFANNFYRSTAAEVPLIIGNLRASGIYIDNASGAIKHYAKNLAGVPGRAFDDDGSVFAVTGVGTAAICDLAHRLKAGRFNACVTCNGVGSYLIAFHTDSTIQEGTPWERPEGVAAMRRLMGGKTVCWWEDHLSNVLRWRALSPAQIVEAMRANVRYCLLFGLRWGMPPAVHVQRGRAELTRNMSLLVELATAGWRPLAPANTDPRLWVGRFGKGAESLLTVSNPTREHIRTEFLVDARGLGLARCALAYHEKTAQGGAVLRNEVSGPVTKIPLELGPKEYRVFRVIPIKDADAIVETSEKRDGYDRLVTTVRTARSPNPDVRVAECSIALGSPKEEMKSFPFLTEGRPSAIIVVSPNPTERELIAATRLSVYFEYWFGRRAGPLDNFSKIRDPSKRLRIVKQGESIPRDAPQIQIEADKTVGARIAVVRSEGRPPVLRLTAPDDTALDDSVLRLLFILDEKYPTQFGMERSEMTDKVGVSGKEFTDSEIPPPWEPLPREPTGLFTVPPDNLLKNGGFEEGATSPEAWRYSSPVPEQHKCEFSADAKEGRRSVYLPRGQYWRQDMKLTPGARYRFSVWRKFEGPGTVLLWPCYLRADGTDAGGPRLYEQCKPNLALIPDFLPAEYFNQPGVWQRSEITFQAPPVGLVSLRVGGWGKLLLDAACLEELRKN